VTRKPIRCYAVVGACALVLAGCGGGGGERLSKGEFTKRANAICSSLGRRSQPIRRQRTRTLADLASVSNSLADVLSDGLSRLDALKEPKDVEHDFARLIATGRRLAGSLHDLADAAAKADTARARRATAAVARLNAEIPRLAGRLRLNECAKS
jgi:hypothetical protein